MGMDLWFRTDVARILQATYEAMCSTAAVVGDDERGSERAAGYRQGFGAALRAVAMAFGLTDPGGVPGRRRPVGGPEVALGGVVIDGMVTGGKDGNHKLHSVSPPSPEGDRRGPVGRREHDNWGERGA